jgi:hypothetical protein
MTQSSLANTPDTPQRLASPLPSISDERASARSIPESSKRLFTQFLERYLGIEGLFVGFQSGFNYRADVILFRAPKTGSTLAVECSVMLQPHLTALAIVKEKIRSNEAQFAGG